MSENKKIEAIIHGERVGPEEQAKFTRRLTLEEICQIITSGAPGKKLLLSKRDDRDDNVVVEYRKSSD